MKTTTRSLILLIPVLLALTLPAKASAAAQRYAYQSSGQIAHAEWDSFDGCVSTYAFVTVLESRTRTGSDSTEYGVVDVALSSYDYCTGQTLVAIYGNAQVGSAVRFTALRSARVSATVPAYDYLTGNIVQIGVDLEWTGEGDVFRSTYRSRFHASSWQYQSSASGSFRYAPVVGGLSIDGVSQTLGASIYSTLGNSRYNSTGIARL